MNINIYTNIDAMPEKIQAQWQHGQERTFDSSFEWYKGIIKSAMKPDSSPLLIVIEKDNHCIILPLQVHHSNNHKYISALSTVYSHNFAPITIFNKTSIFNAASTETPSLTIFANLVQEGVMFAIREHQPSIIDINPIDQNSYWLEPIISAIKKSNMLTDTYFRFGNWINPNVSAIEDYTATLPSQLKNTLKRKQNKLNREHVWEVKIHNELQNLETPYKEYKHLYRLRWKKEEGNNDFVDKIITDLAEKGDLRLGILYIDTKPVAAQIWFNSNKTASIFKLAYDEKYKQFSPGSLLTYDMIQYSITHDHITKLDFLSGDDGYKKQWMSQRDEKWGIIAFNKRSAYGIFSAIKHFCGKFARCLRNFPSKTTGQSCT